ncbi:MAG: NAD-dependent epimerase/dehydratase family protein [Pseudomonadales bacterium]
MSTDRHVLVAGASGLVGRAAVEHFARQDWQVTAVSRRPPIADYGANFVSVDLADADACREVFADAGITHLAFAALHEEPQLVEGWLQESQIERNRAMLTNLVEALEGKDSRLEHLVIVQGPKAYGVHVGPMPVPSRENRDERRDVPNFYWAQEDYLKARQRGSAWHWTVLRPGLVIGEAVGAAMNLIAAIGVYAALQRERGEPLYYPGNRDLVAQPTDTDLMAAAFEWCFASKAADNQIFNVTNGEMMSLKALWPLIAETLGMKPGESRPIHFVEALSDCGAEWDAVRRRYGLKADELDAFIGKSFQFADFCLTLGGENPGPPAMMSTIRIRQAGFGECLDSEEMMAKWFRRYQADRLLPPAD